jgi:beta-mannosidase
VSEVGVPACSSAQLLRHYAGGETLWPPPLGNPLWRYRQPWWNLWERLAQPGGFDPAHEELERFAAVIQREQAEALAYMARSCKRRFPRCGGVMVWMGHDCFRCPSNNSIVEHDGRPKLALASLARVFRRSPEELIEDG